MSESEQRRKTAAFWFAVSCFFVVRGPYEFFSPFTTPRRSFWGPNPLELSSMGGLRELQLQLKLELCQLSAAVLASETLASSSACARSLF